MQSSVRSSYPTQMKTGEAGETRLNRTAVAFFLAALTLLIWGCAEMPGNKMIIKDAGTTYPAGTIISTGTGGQISFDTLIADLADADIIYVGEKHTSASHHAIQLKIIQTLFNENPNLVVGMEMFDRTYQPVLDQWSTGELDEQAFLEKVHWYANWRFDFSLYRDILLYIRDHRIRLIGLNLPFHIPSKIAVGGIENLAETDRKNMAEAIDTSDAAHRSYVEAIFQHHKPRGRRNFDYFYMAQCSWEDTMAESIARNIGSDKMVVLAGNGHIVRKFGIPNRAFRRTQKPFKTIYPEPAGGKIQMDAGDYIWVTE